MTDEAMLEEIAGFLHGYLKSGKVNIQSFFSKVNINIDNIRQLLIIRFLLKKETKDFVRSLPVLMKNLKTATVAKSHLRINEIRGSIDWSQTIVERINTNSKGQKRGLPKSKY